MAVRAGTPNLTIGTKTLTEVYALLGVPYSVDILWNELAFVAFDSFPFHGRD